MGQTTSSPLPPEGFRLLAGTRVVTPGGSPAVETLAPGDATPWLLWTERGWTQCRVHEAGPVTGFYRFTLSDGSIVDAPSDACIPLARHRVAEPDPSSTNLNASSTNLNASSTNLNASSTSLGTGLAGSRGGNASTTSLFTSVRGSSPPSEGSVSPTTGATSRKRAPVPVPAAQVRVGDCLIPRPRLPPLSAAQLVPATEARSLGEHRGGKRGRCHHRLPDAVTGAASAGGMDALRLHELLAGWASQQGGYVIGGRAAMRDLQIALARAGIPRTVVAAVADGQASIAVDPRDVWPETAGEAPGMSATPGWQRRIHSGYQAVKEIEWREERVASYLVVPVAQPLVWLAAANSLALPLSAAPEAKASASEAKAAEPETSAGEAKAAAGTSRSSHRRQSTVAPWRGGGHAGAPRLVAAGGPGLGDSSQGV